MRRLLLSCLALAVILALGFLPACSGGGGGGGSSTGQSLVGTWTRTSAANSPGAVVRITFGGTASGGTFTGVQRDGRALNGNWSLNNGAFRVWGGNINEARGTLRFVDNNNFQLIEADGTSTWRRQ
ncbi:MAG: hypothetical protein COU85_00030 [Candidatus Portnoybacteria bacterium CG10_big_fil_rev_8_21_14_0_10_44_7]|uniref:Lipocalin-like domain-containing protein n=1 Tax=Candidatus Portnoybacteria bacterium CG10_big_fil_rev_8_21_14_0_10_44_7 TaxID=1974816 RepID=A0A2M8KJK6_9BACT|nr:MAG: hypothetical protein COU85_00030 [Candidatus Portnoybacteria bacterium CG10_big_fil_rev_8_21_14_0_10_44_7]